MDAKNMTVIAAFHFLGLQVPQSVRFLVFFLFLIIYSAIIFGNLLIITLVSYSITLHSPMYFFISQLAVSDILLASDVVPTMLRAVLEDTTVISVSHCIAQFYFFAATEMSECLLLTAMSYDRYLAICKPLHYTLLMSHRFCWKIIVINWSLSYSVILISTLTISTLQFCGPDVIDHFFCDLDPIVKLSCSDLTIIQLESTALSVMFAIIPFLIIIVSYVYIIVTILEIPSITGRQKVFSTCSAHLTVVSIFYGTITCVYLIPSRGQSWNTAKFLSLLYTVVTPLLNPIIYSLKNKDLNQVVGKIITNCLNSHFKFQ